VAGLLSLVEAEHETGRCRLGDRRTIGKGIQPTIDGKDLRLDTRTRPVANGIVTRLVALGPLFAKSGAQGVKSIVAGSV